MSTAGVGDPPLVADDTLRRICARLVRPLPADRRAGWVIPGLLALLALGLRLWRLSSPSNVIFDETYYATDSYSLLQHGVEAGKNAVGNPGCPGNHCGFVVHPPLGKWMIAAGEAVFGNTALGWRISGAIVGSVAVLMLARIARRLFRSTALGVIAGGLLALDGLEFVQSRTSMLDIFLMFWVLAAFGCLVLDRDDGRRRLAARLPAPGRSRGPRLGVRPWRLATGGCLGAATAVKWDGLFWVPVFLLLALAWDAGARRTAGVERPFRAALVLDGPVALIPYAGLVAAVYVLSWTGWFLSDGRYAYDHDLYVKAGQSWWQHDWSVLRGWWHYHREILDFHRGLDRFDNPHPYLSRPLGWLVLSRPVLYAYTSPHGCGAATCSQTVLAIGTPALWWASVPALLVTGYRALRFDWRAAAILAAFLAGYLPWFISDAEDRTMFLFYMLPAVPFMVLAVTYALGLLRGSTLASRARRTAGAIAVAAYLVVVASNFAYLYPILSNQRITYDQWQSRMWLQQCPDDKTRDKSQEAGACWI